MDIFNDSTEDVFYTMGDKVKKLKLIFIPFFFIAISFLLSYTFLNWLLFLHLKLFSVKQIILNFLLPFILPWSFILIWLRPRIKLLKLSTPSGDPYFLYQFIAAILIAASTIIAQEYIETATGKLTNLDSIDQITLKEETKFYTLKQFYIDKFNIGINPSFDVSGKFNDDFNMHIYIAMPIVNSISDTLNSNFKYFLGKEYYKRVSNNLSDREKEAEYQNFARESQSDFEMYNPNQFIYLDRIGNTDDRDGLIKAVNNSRKYHEGDPIVLMAINEPFEKRNGNKLVWLLVVFFVGSIIWLMMVIVPKFDKKELKLFEKGKKSKDTDLEAFLYILKPRDGYFITPILIYINLMIFVIFVFSGFGLILFKASDLLVWGANFRPLTSNGEWWRLLTSVFLHGGIMHLVANMYGLLFVGQFLEPVLGSKKYIIIYIITGILASLASIWWYEDTVSVGASGAIFGLYGVFLALLLTKVFPPDFGKQFLISISVFIGFNLLMGLTGGIDNAAHLGGLLSGFIIGFILFPILRNEAIQEIQS